MSRLRCGYLSPHRLCLSADEQRFEGNKSMNTTIRDYQNSDFDQFVKINEDFQDYLVVIDPLKRCRRLPEFGKRYVQRMVERVNKEQGKLLVAENGGKLIGFGTTVIEEQTEDDKLETVESKIG